MLEPTTSSLPFHRLNRECEKNASGKWKTIKIAFSTVRFRLGKLPWTKTFFDFYSTLLQCAKWINGFSCFPLLYKTRIRLGKFLEQKCFSTFIQRYYTSHDLIDYWFIVFLSIDFYHSANRVKVTSFVLIHSTQFLCHQKDSRVIKHTNQTQTQTQTQIQMVISEKRIWFDQSQVRRSPLFLMMNKTPTYWLKNLFDKRCPWNYSEPQYNNLTWFTPNCFVKMKNAFKNAN